MSDLLSAFIISIYAAVIGSNVVAGSAKTDVEAEKDDSLAIRRDAKTDFKRVEQEADADYKAAIADCRKMPSIEKYACLENAKSVNDRKISEARAANKKAVAKASTDNSARVSHEISDFPHGWQ